MDKRRFVFTVVVLIIAAAALIVGSIWYYQTYRPAPSDARQQFLAATQTSSNASASVTVRGVSFSSSTTDSSTSIATTVVSTGAFEIATSDWAYAQYMGGISFRYPTTWSDSNSEEDFTTPTGLDFYDVVASPAIYDFPEFPGTVSYYLTITNEGLDHYQAYGQFEPGPPFTLDQDPAIPVTNSFLENSAQYAVARTIVDTFFANRPILFEEVPPDQNGQSSLMGYAIGFPYPIFYPSSWASDCQFTHSQAQGSPGALYCELMSQPFDFYSPSTTVPIDFCALQFTDSDYVSTSTYNTYTDSANKESCSQYLGAIESEFLENLQSIRSQLSGALREHV